MLSHLIMRLIYIRQGELTELYLENWIPTSIIIIIARAIKRIKVSALPRPPWGYYSVKKSYERKGVLWEKTENRADDFSSCRTAFSTKDYYRATLVSIAVWNFIAVNISPVSPQEKPSPRNAEYHCQRLMPRWKCLRIKDWFLSPTDLILTPATDSHTSIQSIIE